MVDAPSVDGKIERKCSNPSINAGLARLVTAILSCSRDSGVLTSTTRHQDVPG